MSKLTAQANRKAISEIASGGCPGDEWPVIVKDLSRKSSDHYALYFVDLLLFWPALKVVSNVFRDEQYKRKNC